MEISRDIPVVGEADVIVVGGSTGAVAAAVAARQAGASVWLVAPHTYLGEDLCATLRLFSTVPDATSSDLAARVFTHEQDVTPMQVKRVLDEALLDADVRFLFGCRVSDVIVDDQSRLAGVVIANRCGRQALLGKAIVDGSEHAVVARLAGAEFTPYPSGVHRFTRIVVGGEPVVAEGVSHRVLDRTVVDDQGAEHPVIEYSLDIAMRDGTVADRAEAEQVARDRTFHRGQVDAADTLFEVSPCHVLGESHVESWPGVQGVELDAFKPRGVSGALYVLGDQADLSRTAAGELIEPDAFIACGTRLGREIANLAKNETLPGRVRVGGMAACGDGECLNTQELLLGLRPIQQELPSVHAGPKPLPVFAEVDVLVVGAGTVGAPAAVAAAADGARTLVVEPLHVLGGVMTAGLIGRYYFGCLSGFTAQIDAGVEKIGAAVDVVGKSEWLRRQIREAGGEIWFGVTACGALVRQDSVVGVVVVTPQGRGLIRARTVIDATGSADVAAAAGADCVYIEGEHVGLQGSGLPPRDLGKSYTNTDYTFADDGDMVDMWRMFVVGRQRFPDAYDLGQLLDTRERRRIVPELMLDPLDHINHRTFPDTIMVGHSNFDSHGFTVHPYFLLCPPDHDPLTVDVPLRTLLPRGLKGIVVTGLAAGGHRDAMPIIRMQPDLQNQGCAVGMLAAAAARDSVDVRDVDVRAIQRRLVDKWCLPKRVLTDTDSSPICRAELREAVNMAAGHWRLGLAKLLTNPEAAVDLLRDAFEAAEDSGCRLKYAHALGILGDVTGADMLADSVAAADWDEGWNYRGMGQFGFSMSPLDSRIVALGRTGATIAVRVIAEKIGQLGPEHEFSHHRAVAMAAEALGASELAAPLAKLLATPEMSGYSLGMTEIEREFSDTDRCSNRPRNGCLRELVLSRALYRCGDHDGVGEGILRQYRQDVRGAYARHADAVLMSSVLNS